MENSLLTMQDLPVLSLGIRGSTRNCSRVWVSRRNGRLFSILGTVRPRSSLPRSTEREWTRLRLSTRILMEDSQDGAPSLLRRASLLLVLWWLRPILMRVSRLMGMPIECTLSMKRGFVRCRIEYSHPTLHFLRKDPRVLSWSRLMLQWSWMRSRRSMVQGWFEGRWAMLNYCARRNGWRQISLENRRGRGFIETTIAVQTD